VDLNVLCLATYFKGERFMREAAALGARVYLLTAAKLLKRPWPRDILADVFAMRDGADLGETTRTVAYLARNVRFDRIVALDDFDVETAASLREHLRIPGMGDTTARHFRDKLAMRVKARDEGIVVPEFVHVLNYDAVRDFMRRIPAPWMNKPRSEASAAGITKVQNEEQLWELVNKQGDRQSFFLLEQYVPGDVYHVDSIVSERAVLFAAVHKCGEPPFDVAHGGGVFSTSTVEYGSRDEAELRALSARVLECMNLVRGVSHIEFIKGRDGRFYMLECAARVGGAHIADMVEAATGINLWAEWARIEVGGGKAPYAIPEGRREYGGLILTLARDERPDTSMFDAPEVVFHSPEKHHVGLVLRSPQHARVQQLLAEYLERIRPLVASMPALEKPTN
jgi:phosphoribosylaminoimidazole carboxylase (NCAIR synthetase)